MSDRRAEAVVGWIDDYQARRERERLRDQGRSEILRSLMLGELKIRDVVAGGWFRIPSPWTDADVERWGVTREQVADSLAPARSLPPPDDSPAAALPALDALRAVRATQWVPVDGGPA